MTFEAAGSDLPLEESDYQPSLKAAVARGLGAWKVRKPMASTNGPASTST